MRSGSFCVSIDLELAWGIWDKPSAAYHERCQERERSIVTRLLALFERYEVPVTWAIVGRLVDADDARGTAPIWYAPDLVDAIRGSRVAHDIGSHSYAHIYFGEASREALRADLASARRAHERLGLGFVSFVFPRNQVGHLDLLKEAGIRVYRSTDRAWHLDVRSRAGTTAGRIANLVDKALPIAPAVVEPIAHDGLIELPSSMLLLGRNGLRRIVRPAATVAKARAGLTRAAREARVFHLWFHPSNFYYDTDRQFDTLEDILTSAKALCRRGELVSRPMSAFAA